MREVDFTTPGAAGPIEGRIEAVRAAAARMAVDLSPTTSLGVSRLISVTRAESGESLPSTGTWFPVTASTGTGVVMLDSALAVAVADALMGGPGESTPRALTSVEEGVLHPHVQRGIRHLGNALTGSEVIVGAIGRGVVEVPGPLLVVEVGIVAEVAQEASGDPFAQSPFGAMESASAELGSLRLALPAPAGYQSLERVRTNDDVYPEGAFRDVPLPVSVRTRWVPMPAARMESLSVGDLIPLRHPADEPLIGLLAGMPRLKVDLSSQGGHIVAHILECTTGPHHQRIWPDDTRVRPPWPARAKANRPAVEATATAYDTPQPTNSPEEPMPTYDPELQQAIDATDSALDAGRSPQVAVPGESDGLDTPVRLPGLGTLADVPVEVAVEVGRTVVTLREALELTPGEVLTLDAESGAPAAILVNGRVVARGQVLVVGDSYGVRVTDLLDAGR